MIQARPDAEDLRREQAAEWVVRLQSPEGEFAEAEALAFDAWLGASPANAAAYDAAHAVWGEYAANAGAVRQGLAERGARAPMRRGLLFAGAAAAAALAAVMVLPQLSGPRTQTFETGVGERRTVALADGSTVDLDAATRLSVTLARDIRRVELTAGEAVFDVSHDPRRPFLVAAGDRTVRVVGTQFDVRRREGLVAVTVARGAVEVRPSSGAGRAYRLHPGQRLEHREGAAAAQVAAADPAEVLGWRAGRLVYRDRPLAEVVADLNRQFPAQIRIDDPGLAAERVSAVLVLDDQAAVIRRLALLVPISAVPSGSGLILRREGAPGR